MAAQFLRNSLSLSVGAAIGVHLSMRAIVRLRPYPMPHQFAKLLDHPARMRYRDPVETLGLFGVRADMTMLDLGCGTGTFTVEMARMVGAGGIVHAVDLQRPMVEQTRARIDATGLGDRVRLHHCGAYKLPLEDDSVDLAVSIATLSQIPNPQLALWELKRVLKPGARLAISEELPDPAYVLPAVARHWAEEAGFAFGGKTGSPFCYSLIFFNQD